MRRLVRMLRDDRCLTVIENGLIALLIVIAAITAGSAFATQLSAIVSNDADAS